WPTTGDGAAKFPAMPIAALTRSVVHRFAKVLAQGNGLVCRSNEHNGARPDTLQPVAVRRRTRGDRNSAGVDPSPESAPLLQSPEGAAALDKVPMNNRRNRSQRLDHM